MNNIEKSFFLALALLFANMGHAQNQMPKGEMTDMHQIGNLPNQKMEPATNKHRKGPKRTVQNGTYYTIPGALYGGWSVDGNGYYYSMAMVPPFVDVTFANKMADKTKSTWEVDGDDMADHVDENGNLVCRYAPRQRFKTPVLGHESQTDKYQYNEDNYWVKTGAREVDANSFVATYSSDLMMTPADNHGTRYYNGQPYRNELYGYGFLSTAFLFGTGTVDGVAAFGFEQTFNPLLAPMYIEAIHVRALTYNSNGPIPEGKSVFAYILTLDDEGNVADTTATFEATATDNKDFKLDDDFNGKRAYYGNLVYKKVKEQEGNADEMSNLAAIPAGKPWRIQFEGMNKEGVNIGVYAIYKNDVENTYIENSYILFENGEEHTFLAPLCADILLLGQYEMIDVKDKGLLELERQEDFPTDLFKGWNVLHVSEDGTTTNTEGLAGHDAFDMGVAFVGTSSPWYDENGKENYQVDKNQIPEWVEGFEVDTTCYSSASLAGYNKVRPVCKPLPGGLSGRVCSLDICGRAGIVGNNKIVIIQGSDPSDIPVFRGDANGDLQVSVNDILAIVNYLNDHPNSLFIYANADADGNGKIDMEDIKTIVMIILGLENVSD